MKSKNIEIYNILDEMHPKAGCELVHNDPFELIVAVILSAQCTDRRVNIVTEELFKVIKTPEDLVNIDRAKLEEIIHPCGFYHNKAENLQKMGESVVKLFNGQIPNNREDLMKLAGVGRKTANVVLAEAFGKNAIAVDTHVFRVSNRIGLVNEDTPEATELALMREFDEEKWSHLHHLLIFQGRYICDARKPKCGQCGLKKYCKYYKNNEKLK